jgi:hypothetical protein
LANFGVPFELRCDSSDWAELGILHIDYGVCCHGNQNDAGGQCIMTYADAVGPRNYCSYCQAHLDYTPELNCHSPESPISHQVIEVNILIYPNDKVTEKSIILIKGRSSQHFPKGEDYYLVVSDPKDKVLLKENFDIHFDYAGPIVLEGW